ncbi:MAG: peptide-methionine (S)-S-oxide reductase MsrA [Anaerolineae bacterium]
METATLGGGCFWCLEAVYQEVKGVQSVVSGYAGGHVENPSYRHVTTGETGHAEVVQVTYDSDIVSYDDILNVFFTIHDPTTLNRQGADVGTQYRSVIYTHDEAQREAAAAKISELTDQQLYPNPIVTEVTPLGEFYRAEDYHQNYYRTNPAAGYCQVVIAPKLAKFRKVHVEHLKV